MSNRAKDIPKGSLYIRGIDQENIHSQIETDLQNIFLILRKFPNYGVQSTAVSYTATTSDYVIAVTSTASARTITLPLAGNFEKGQLLIIKDESGAANVNNITIDASGAEVIDGAATKVINTAYGSATLYSNSVSWFSV